MGTEKKNRLPLITTILVVINIVVFLISDLLLYKQQDEIAFYMALNPILVLRGKEYWRLVTSMFYHFGIEHLMCNMLMLYLLGVIVEPFFGRVRFFILYFVSGLLADMASIIYNGFIIDENAGVVFCAGASGAIYGLVGAFVAIFLFLKDKVPAEERRRFPIAIFFLLFGSIFDTGVGNEAHFGGFIAGVLLGSVYCACMRMRKRSRTVRKNKLRR